MTDAYSTYDTLTIGDLAKPTDLPSTGKSGAPVIARLPRVDPNATPTVRRVDDPEPTAPSAHFGDHPPVDAVPAVSRVMAQPGAPSTSIRIDEAPVAPPEPETAPQPSEEPTPVSAPVAPQRVAIRPAADPALDDEWGSWLLNLEAAVQPYSRWIALTAVIAALGLTIVLLRGGATAVSAPEPPSASSDVAADMIEIPSQTLTPIEPTQVAETETTTPVAAATQPFAAGPASNRTPSRPHELMNEVRSPANVAEKTPPFTLLKR